MQNTINDVKKTFFKTVNITDYSEIGHGKFWIVIDYLHQIPVRKALISNVADINLFSIILEENSCFHLE